MSSDRLSHAESVLDELEQLERRLEQLQQGLTRSHRLVTIGTMASIIAHEFNNILTPVISYCQMAIAAGESDPALTAKALQRALSGAEKAAQISSSMLGFARDEDAAPACNIAEVVDEVFACLARDPKRDGIRLDLDLPSDLRAAISPVELQQVMMNLVLNARRAMNRRGGTLSIGARVVEADRLLITVSDSGPGIPEDLLPNVFEPFVTRRSDDGAQPKGTGLGLAVCRDLVERADGRITASNSERGAVFHVELPCDHSHATNTTTTTFQTTQ